MKFKSNLNLNLGLNQSCMKLVHYGSNLTLIWIQSEFDMNLAWILLNPLKPKWNQDEPNVNLIWISMSFMRIDYECYMYHFGTYYWSNLKIISKKIWTQYDYDMSHLNQTWISCLNKTWIEYEPNLDPDLFKSIQASVFFDALQAWKNRYNPYLGCETQRSNGDHQDYCMFSRCPFTRIIASQIVFLQCNNRKNLCILQTFENMWQTRSVSQTIIVLLPAVQPKRARL